MSDSEKINCLICGAENIKKSHFICIECGSEHVFNESHVLELVSDQSY